MIVIEATTATTATTATIAITAITAITAMIAMPATAATIATTAIRATPVTILAIIVFGSPMVITETVFIGINMIICMIGTTELILIGALVLLLFGGKKLPELMKGLGQGIRSFKQGMNEPIKDEKPVVDNEVKLPEENVTDAK